MIDDMQAKLNEIGQHFDKRTHFCELAIAKTDDGRWRLTGRALDEGGLAKVVAELSREYTDHDFETADVEILRPGRQMTVGTGVTGLHAGPSFAQEMATQLLGGWIVEELIAEDSWSFVRQLDGYLGWAYRPYLIQVQPPEQTHLVAAPICLVHVDPDSEASLSGRLAAGTPVRVEHYEGEWACLDSAAGQQGWSPAAHLRSLSDMPDSEAGRRAQIMGDAAAFMGIPYLWGGITAFGLDCSGYAQLLHRLVGVTIPRDADMQFAVGQPVDPPFQAGDLLFFGSPGGHRDITHVGMSLSGWRIIHSSRSRNGVYVDDIREVKSLNDAFAGARTFLSSSAD